jgi:putative hydrolase
MSPAVNTQAARRLEEVASLLHEQGANPHRVHAYRRAAETLARLSRPITDLVREEGPEGLVRLPGIGVSLARSILVLVQTGRLPMLERLRGEVDPETVLRSVPGIGEATARRLHHDLGIDSLEDLETAAQDGRLAQLAGRGEKRVAGIIDSLATRLGRVRAPDGTHRPADAPPVEEVLDVDREYRDGVSRGTLPRIAPRRLNPSGEAWLPVLHTHRGERHYTALFSNTARAHHLGKTHDWVVVYFDGPQGEGQCTVITAEWGPLAGCRIVRGRERECGRDGRAEAAAPRQPVQMDLLRTG